MQPTEPAVPWAPEFSHSDICCVPSLQRRELWAFVMYSKQYAVMHANPTCKKTLLRLLSCSWSWPRADPATAAAEGAPARACAADVLSQLMAQPTHGPRVRMVLGKLLPPGLVAAIAEGPPDTVLRALGQVGL